MSLAVSGSTAKAFDRRVDRFCRRVLTRRTIHRHVKAQQSIEIGYFFEKLQTTGPRGPHYQVIAVRGNHDEILDPRSAISRPNHRDRLCADEAANVAPITRVAATFIFGASSVRQLLARCPLSRDASATACA